MTRSTLPLSVSYGEAIKIADVNGDTVATMNNVRTRGRRPTNEVEADAAFIARAVNAHDEMVIALRKIEGISLNEAAMTGRLGDRLWCAGHKHIADAARAALAKAEGK